MNVPMLNQSLMNLLVTVIMTQVVLKKFESYFLKRFIINKFNKAFCLCSLV